MDMQMLVLAALAGCLTVAVVALVVAWRGQRRARQFSLRQRAMLEDLAALRTLAERAVAGLDNAGSERLRLARQVLALEGELDELRARMTRSPGFSASLPDRVLDGAMRRAREGAGVDLLVHEYGMSQAEAELLIKLHGGSRAVG